MRFKRLIRFLSVALALLFVLPYISYGQDLPDDLYENTILGTWIDEKGESKSEFYRNDDNSFGAKLVWCASPKKQDRVGLVYIKDMTYNASDSTWTTSYLYSPDHGLTARGTLWIKDGILHVRGRKFGISATRRFSRVVE
ncbi:MAG: DUF2147 domain-containing protein [Bacteroidales bacterium]|nr:DUF2147 domain-containing protein [Bacteroidales bacterium]